MSDEYEVLCGDNLFWEYKTGSHKYDVDGGHAGDGTTFYVCRGYLDGNTIPGKLYRPFGCCYVVSYGKEHCLEDYYVGSRCCNLGR